MKYSPPKNASVNFRSGKILKEGSPLSLMMENPALCSLEDVFYDLCYGTDPTGQSQPLLMDHPESIPKTELKTSKSDVPSLVTPSADQSKLKEDVFRTRPIAQSNPFRALFYKNFLALKRHTIFMTFFVCMPLVSLGLFILCIGKMPRGLTISAVVHNADEENLCQSSQSFAISNHTCWEVIDYGGYFTYTPLFDN